VVGGGAVAARKVQLLLKAHARVRIVAPTLHSELMALRDAGRVQHIAETFLPAHFEQASFAIAATDSSEVNQAVARTGTSRNVFVNVVDDAEASTAIMPSIVDRTPVIVAIGTSGQSPTLARRLRAQVEAMLPQRLGELAHWAGAMRERVRLALPDPDRRRPFWDQLFDGNAASAVLAGRADEATQLLEQQLRRSCADEAAARGEVYLIGAGPGDPDLLTLRALQLMQQADVVLYDRLVSPEVLERVRRDAQRIDVGKQSGQHRMTQDRIHALLLEHARRGLRVARLKGGDPFIFGRGGEEIDLLHQAGIPVIVVPGVTAALGAAAGAAVPLTQRGLAPSVTFVTATGDGAADLNWRSLAAPMQTVVFYMGVVQLPRIVEHLRAHGAPDARPVVIVERATLPQQRIVAGSLGNIVGLAQRMQLEAPALLIVGDVASRAARTSAVIHSSYAGVSQT
jgi:uroporphyrin-III C-methyltransferase / precorrin-2 dehydrogenase / sirohydrochlorin ferrochelatase